MANQINLNEAKVMKAEARKTRRDSDGVRKDIFGGNESFNHDADCCISQTAQCSARVMLPFQILQT